ncbi:FixJ family two-component response regulator [Anaerosolibacter carboniphilus]|uniref:Stage 0 sporulation protein A homolog n=1 Tax=Anaerosolibacter carboniphilus TaxID=1417629 RepID=A0A841KS13_9FIRM|nr:response regulator [Anaerosolibacter carboniphilus]MBB6214938.1 FixJ family two-component response regulator [Anaerosolibacter carboniphilus]
MIYIVDDNFQFAEITKEYLESIYKNITIKAFYNPRVVLKNVFIDRPELIITDKGLPIVDGIALLENINQVYRPKAIMVSSMANNIMSDLVDEYMVKPCDYKILVMIIDKLLKIEVENEITISEQTINHILQNLKGTFADRLLIKQILYAYKDIKDLSITQVYDYMSEINGKSPYAIKEQISKIRKMNFSIVKINSIERSGNKEFLDSIFNLYCGKEAW